MKNTIKLFGIIAIGAIIVFSLAACPADDGNGGGGNSGLNGTWVGTDKDGVPIGETKLNNGSYEFTNYFFNAVSEKGTYSATDTKITYTPTHIRGSYFSLEAQVYSKGEILSALEMTDEQFSQVYIGAFQPYSADYFPNENKIVFEAGATYTKK